MQDPRERFEAELGEALRCAVAALRDAGVPFAIGGGVACWGRGGPPVEHDVDVFVRPQDAERALEALAAAGMRPERPPEEWLLKAWHGDSLVDVIFRPSGFDVTDEVLARAEQRQILALTMPLLALKDVLVSKLAALDEHRADFEDLLEIGRSLREQVDWAEARARTRGWPFAEAYFVLLRELGIVDVGEGTGRRGSGRAAAADVVADLASIPRRRARSEG